MIRPPGACPPPLRAGPLHHDTTARRAP